MIPLLLVVSTLCALCYGAVFVHRRDSLARSVVKTGAVGALTGVSLWAGLPVLLSLALFLGALGDLALSRRGGRAFLLGLSAFLLGHFAYVPLLLETGAGVAVLWETPWRAGLLALLCLLAGALLRWGLTDLGRMRGPVWLYSGVILLMGGAALTLPLTWPATLGLIGALAFIASDAILGLELFGPPRGPRVTWWRATALWALYWGGQLCLLLSFLLPAT
ncbi:lysoplasmalogenase family protein [Thalassorhabdomicrobium marinisediminis]|uniref:lysoplasmalogenase family protein n=1 Tax=Thalassorhabdomicrobium marinisediminis TaxID=2170577 RepID=UPI0024922E38|nr:lysoplasmalogenase family protein [Thalassorhabdomicrobium marinisediminis]